MKLAKDAIDLGLYTNAREAMLAFWQEEVGLAFEETLRVGGGVHQLRHAMNGSVMKINHARDPLPSPGPCGYRELRIARAGLAADRLLVDPDGNHVRLVPSGAGGVEGIGVHLAVRDVDAQHRFYREALGLSALEGDRYRVGSSVLSFGADHSLPADMAETRNAKLQAVGFRYLTIQVWDVDVVHARVVARGGGEGLPPSTLGQVARISFVRDPDGNWIELSQRASLTGALPD